MKLCREFRVNQTKDKILACGNARMLYFFNSQILKKFITVYWNG